MSIVFPKNKEKRSRSSSEDANNSSFMKNVTSRVSGLLPAAVTKWFSSPSSSSNANGSAQTADATDSSTEDEGPESSVTSQPPAKRMRYTSPLTCISSNIEQHELDVCSPYASIQSPPGRATFRRETNFVSTPLRSEHMDRTDDDSTFKSHSHTVSAIAQSVATKRKSIFDSPSRDHQERACAKTACNKIRDPTQPYFKASLLGSPFYPGRTMYGGASSSYINQPNIKQTKNAIVNESNAIDNTVSHSTRRIMELLENYSSPIADAKRIPQYTISRSHSLTSSSSTPPSNKILSYKTQELHVPSIASILRLKQKSRIMDTTNVARQILASHSSTSDCVPYPTHMLKTQREQADIECSNKSTTKVITRISRPTGGGNKDAQTEMPVPVSLPNAVLQIDQNNLPKFTFGISAASSTPKPAFTPLTTEVKTKIPETPLRKPDIVTSSQAPYKFSSPVRISSEAPQHQTEATLPKFTFGSPDRSIDEGTKQKKSDFFCVVGPPKEPENKGTSAKSKDWQCSDCWVFNKADVEKCVCCGGKKPSEDGNKISKCCICKHADSTPNNDKCINCETSKTNVADKPFSQPGDSLKWKCEDCWVNNDENVEKCVCCGGSNPKKAKTEKGDAVATDSISEWKCDDCWIKNSNRIDKCAACGVARPGATGAVLPTPVSGSLFNSPYKPPDNALKSIIKTQTKKWECPTCLVRNDADKAKCICCESERAGTVMESNIKSFNFGMNTNTTFKFGIPKTQDTPKNTDVGSTSAIKKEESETNNNILPKTASFTFGVPTKKTEDQTNTPTKTDKADDAPKTNFTFGVPKASVAPTVPTIFGIATKLPEQETKAKEQEKEKPQEVPVIDCLTPKNQESPKPSSNIFISPVGSQQNTENAAVVPALTNQTNSRVMSIFSSTVEKKDLSNSLTVSAAPVSSEQSPLPVSVAVSKSAPAPAPALTLAPAPTPVSASAPTTAPEIEPKAKPETTLTATAPAFSFGTTGAGFKPAANLFGTPATTAGTTAVTFATTLSAPTNSAPFQKSELTTTSSAMSLFPKSETSSTVSLFAKPEVAASTTAAPTSTAPAPLFSFGGAAQNLQPENPKFNFTFGANNKTETPALFQPTTDNKFSFGAPTDNKFSLTTGSTLGNNSALGGNGLSSGSTLGGGNGLTMNILGGSAMGNNPQGGGNGLQTTNASGGLFGAGAGAQKENMWSTAKSAPSNLFVPTTTTNSLQKAPAFTFGSSTPFNANSTPTFGSTTQSPLNVFGMNQTANNPSSVFGSTSTSQPGGVVFGTPQPTPAPLFGSANVGAAPTFGTPNPPAPSFDAPSHTPAPAPAFNFGASAPQTTGVFGFGQQAQQQAGAFSFGASAGVTAPQVQFNMGSAPNMAVRRVRKAVRRTTPR